jgi:UDP-N-acetylmuramyl pentapeptide phosphotransferase/UDP-N-acetylglucosamine-1-phosphate transferase
MIPIIIHRSERHQLFDRTDGRKVHKGNISRLGGLGISAAFLAISFLWFVAGDPSEIAYLIPAILTILFIGILDDLRELSPKYKFIGQFIAAFLIAHAGIRIESLFGILGVWELPLFIQYAITILTITGVLNAINLMDGIDGLAAGVSMIGLSVLGTLHFLVGNIEFAIMGFSLAGALLAFLRYNFHPAKIFMGDTGSMLLGFILAVLGVKLISTAGSTQPWIVPGEMVILVTGILMVPVYDTLRVVATRLLKGRSPFSPDMTHMHHLLIQTGFHHRPASIILYISTICVIISAFFLKAYPPGFSVFAMGLIALISTEILTLRRLLAILLNRRNTLGRVSQIGTRNKLIIHHVNKNNLN